MNFFYAQQTLSVRRLTPDTPAINVAFKLRNSAFRFFVGPCSVSLGNSDISETGLQN